MLVKLKQNCEKNANPPPPGFRVFNGLKTTDLRWLPTVTVQFKPESIQIRCAWNFRDSGILLFSLSLGRQNAIFFMIIVWFRT